MKKILLFLFAGIFMSCSTTSFYQVYKTNLDPSTNYFEDQNCRVTYDLWSPGGATTFTIYNKTDKPITVKLDQSFFVMNDRAFDYFKSRTFVESMNESTVVSSVNNYYWFTMNQTRVATTTKNEIEYQEVPSVIIPAKTMKTFSEYLVTNSTYENCDLKKFPNKRQMKTISFDSSNSPYIFYNSITYFVDGQQHSMKNEFYVSEITNVPESEAFEQRKVDDCGKSKLVKVSNYARPDRFYIHYFGTR